MTEHDTEARTAAPDEPTQRRATDYKRLEENGRRLKIYKALENLCDGLEETKDAFLLQAKREEIARLIEMI